MTEKMMHEKLWKKLWIKLQKNSELVLVHWFVDLFCSCSTGWRPELLIAWLLQSGNVEFKKMTEEKSTHNEVCLIIFCIKVYHTSENKTPSPRIVSASLNPSYQNLVTSTEDACPLILFSYWFSGKQSFPRLLTRWLWPIFSKPDNKLMRCLSNDII